MQLGDSRRRVAAVLRETSRHAPAPARPPERKSPAIGNYASTFLQGSRLHRLNLEQRGPEIAGQQRSTQFEGPVSGWLNGDQIQLSFTSRYEGSTICYFFDGEIRGGSMTGTAMLGAASDQNQGIVNRSQFGPGRWQASRLG